MPPPLSPLPSPPSPLIADIRAASRDLVRQFGLMNRTVAGTDLSVSAVHAIIEIGRADGLTAKQLSARRRLEKSTVSRLVRSLVARGALHEARAADDGRARHLHLTRQGAATLRAIDGFADAQVAGALARLDARARRRVLAGLRDYAAALGAVAPGAGPWEAGRPGPGAPDDTAPALAVAPPVAIRAGYAPGLIGRIVDMLLRHMHAQFGFGAAFEARIAGDLAGFVSRLASSRNEIWRAERAGAVVGSISIDGEDLGDGLAHLRWFVVDDAVRGGGVGAALLARALDFCDARGARETRLWTVKGLDAARRLYERHGFVLAEEYDGDQWGSLVREQKFVRPRAGG